MFDSPIVRAGVLASGRGSNFAAILRKEQEGYFQKLKLSCLVSNQPDAGALELANSAGLPAHVVVRKDYSSQQEFESRIISHLQQYEVQLIILAGYMRIVGPTLLEHFPGRIVNIHPALLPSFPGLHGQKQALDYGVKIAGCTVHFVDSGVDTGPIIGQRAVPVLETDNENSLSARILEQEHQLYSECLKRITETPWTMDGRRVRFM